MEYMKKFATQSDHDAEYYNDETYKQPWLAAIEGSNVPTYNKYNYNGHEYVDLGLPSKTLWAKYNVGATAETEFGEYFASCETEPKSNYAWSTYKWGTSQATLTKYSQSCVIDPEDDAARVNMGGNWRLPTMAQWKELFTGTTRTWETIDGVPGNKFTSKTDATKYIFMPASGRYQGTTFKDTSYGAFFWCRNINGNSAERALVFESKRECDTISQATYGHTVRGVIDHI